MESILLRTVSGRSDRRRQRSAVCRQRSGVEFSRAFRISSTASGGVGKLIAGTPGSANFGNTDNLLLALITIVSTVLFARLLKGMCRQLAILLGLIVGAFSAALMGDISLSGVGSGPLLALPSPFPFGPPNFDLIAALPLLLFTLISMVEATGQTIALNEVLGKEDEAERDEGPGADAGNVEHEEDVAKGHGPVLGSSPGT